MSNLLINPGFEADWGSERDHRVLVFPQGGDSYVKEEGNIFTPPGWLTWFKHVPGTWDQPEVKLLQSPPYPERVSEGRQAVCMFSFGRNHDGGFLQQVELPGGKAVTVFLRSITMWPFRHNDAYWDRIELVQDGAYLTLTAEAHAWSNHNDVSFPHPDDPRWSEGVGYGAAYVEEADVPPLNGDRQNDAIGNFTFYVGIDPAGGQNPYAETVVWGPGACIYNEYADVPYLTYRVAGLFGQPRVQYERTYVLLPPEAGADWAMAAVAAMWEGDENARFTIGGSADDAGIGDLEKRRVIAVNPQQWPDDLQAFFETYYPGVEYVGVEAETSFELIEALSQFAG